MHARRLWPPVVASVEPCLHTPSSLVCRAEQDLDPVNVMAQAPTPRVSGYSSAPARTTPPRSRSPRTAHRGWSRGSRPPPARVSSAPAQPPQRPAVAAAPPRASGGAAGLVVELAMLQVAPPGRSGCRTLTRRRRLRPCPNPACLACGQPHGSRHHSCARQPA